MFIAVVKTPSGNLWIMAVLTPLFLLMVVIGMVAFILCQRNRVIFKTGAFRTFKTRSKVGLLNLVMQLHPFTAIVSCNMMCTPLQHFYLSTLFFMFFLLLLLIQMRFCLTLGVSHLLQLNVSQKPTLQGNFNKDYINWF